MTHKKWNGAKFILWHLRIFNVIVICFNVLVLLFGVIALLACINGMVLEMIPVISMAAGVVTASILCVGGINHWYSKMIYQMEITEEQIICYCGYKKDPIQFTRKEIKEIINDGYKTTFELASGRKVWAYSKKWCPDVIKGEVIEKEICAEDFVGVKIVRKNILL